MTTEIAGIHVLIATVVTLIICGFTGVIVFPDGGQSVMEFIVTWVFLIAVVWGLEARRHRDHA
jgi:hypothetical protein